MALRLRRGLDLDRAGVIFAEGELVYTTDTKRLHIGDGVTSGGIPVGDLVGDRSPQLGATLDLNTHNIVGVGDILVNGDVSSTGTIFANTIVGNFKGTFSADDSTILIDGVNNKLILNNNSITDLSDVDTNGVQAGDVLKWDGFTWTPNTDDNATINELTDLLDVNTNGVEVGDVLKWDGFNWIPTNNSISGTVTADLKGSVFGDDSTILVDGVNNTLNLSNNVLDNLFDVNTTGVQVGNVLKWDGFNWTPNTDDNATINELTDLLDVDTTGVQVGDVLTWDGFTWTPNADNSINGIVTADLKGSVFGDDSSILVDGVNNTINLSNNVLDDLFDVNTTGVQLGDILTWDGFTWIPDTNNNIISGTITADLKGSVFGDDSSLIINGLTGDITTSNINTQLNTLTINNPAGITELLIESKNNRSRQNFYVTALDAVTDLSTYTGYYATINFGYRDTPNGSTVRGTIRGSDSDIRIAHDLNEGFLSDETKYLTAKDGNFGIGTYTPQAKLDVRGAIMPGVYADTVARDAAISAPVAGMIVYLSSTNKHQGYNGTTWNDFY